MASLSCTTTVPAKTARVTLLGKAQAENLVLGHCSSISLCALSMMFSHSNAAHFQGVCCSVAWRSQ